MTVTAQPSSLTIVTPQGCADDWCLFEHSIIVNQGEPPQVIYVGTCRLRDVYKLIEARRNSEWRRIVTDRTPLFLRILQTGDKGEMIRASASQVRTYPAFPRCNLVGHDAFAMTKALICSNGETYKSQADAADSLGVSQSAISRHLRGEVRHVRGYTFAYVD